MALGGFKTDESQQALETGLLNPDVSIYCQAALYRQTGEPKYLVQIAKVLRKDEWPASILADYLGKVKVPAVQALVKRYRERAKAEGER